jgi:formylmethanofuran dehydrogenase subunit E
MVDAETLREPTLAARSFESLLLEAVRFHGHQCPGQVLGVRMVLAGCRAIGIEHPREAGKDLVVFVEIDRCATDAIQALTGVSLGKRTLKHLDYGRMAATFVDVPSGKAVRVVARDSARARAREWSPYAGSERDGQIAAYRGMPESELLALQSVRIDPGWLDRRRIRVHCESCEEGINYEREIIVDGRTLCRACGKRSYYSRIEQ